MARALSEGKELGQLSLEAYREAHLLFEEDIYRALDPEVAVERRDLPGAPAKRRVLAAMADARARIEGRGV